LEPPSTAAKAPLITAVSTPTPTPAPSSSVPVTTPALPRKLRYEDFSLADVTGIRNLLRGGSVIDWHRLYFVDRDEVDRFLRVNEFDPRDDDAAGDVARVVVRLHENEVAIRDARVDHRVADGAIRQARSHRGELARQFRLASGEMRVRNRACVAPRWFAVQQCGLKKRDGCPQLLHLAVRQAETSLGEKPPDILVRCVCDAHNCLELRPRMDRVQDAAQRFRRDPCRCSDRPLRPAARLDSGSQPLPPAHGAKLRLWASSLTHASPRVPRTCVT